MSMIEFPRIKLDDLRADFPGVFDAARHVDVGIGWLPLVRAFVDEALPYHRTVSNKKPTQIPTTGMSA